MEQIKDNKLNPGNFIYEELTYKIIGLAYKVNRIVGFGQTEKVYSLALEELFKRDHISYARELYAPIVVNGKVITKRYFDFFIENKIVVELKVGPDNYREACSQIFHYIKQNDIKLGIIIRFTKTGVVVKRLPNLR